VTTQSGWKQQLGTSGKPVVLANPPSLEAAARRFSYRLSKYVPHKPTPKQAAALWLANVPEVFYGGAAGGGKSDWLLMDAMQYVDIPSYSAIIFRKSFQDLSLRGAIMNRAQEWLSGTDVHWDDELKTFTFPSGATLSFGYMQHDNERFRYKSAEFQFIGWDELTQFTSTMYTFLFSRLRRNEDQKHVPLRMRSASNPGDIGHEWVKERFVDPETREDGVVFIPATLADNPFLDREEYEKSLSHMTPYERDQMLNGNWFSMPPGEMFTRDWFDVIPAHLLPSLPTTVRYWDFAGTAPKPGKKPDWTAGVKVGMFKDQTDRRWYILDVRRIQGGPDQVERLVARTAEDDGIATRVWLEEEPGSAGIHLVNHYQKNVLPGFVVRGDRVTGPKTVRAAPWAGHASNHRIVLVRGRWNKEFLDEAEQYPYGKRDQVDAACGGLARTIAKKTARSY
jgi:predicted phage terminase large subunit-like protein